MVLRLIELLSDESEQPYLNTSEVRFRKSNHDLIGNMAQVSETTDCRLMVFVELPVGFKSNARIPDRDQTAVVLSGVLNVSGSEEDERRVEAGGVFRIPKAETSSHLLEVLGTDAVTLLVLQT